MSARAATVALLAALALAAASDASAQGRGRGARGGAEKSGQARDLKVDPLEETIEELRVDLKLAPEQQPAWDAYVDKVRALVLDIARERGRAADLAKERGALKRIDHTVDVARDRLTALEDIASAAKALYGKLTPEQQRIADPRLAALVPAVSAPQPARPAPRTP